MFFAARLYRMNLITIGDYYVRDMPYVEVLTSIAIIISYLGWVAAQILALGLVFSFVTQECYRTMKHGDSAGLCSFTPCSAALVVALTDAFQMTIIVVAMLYLAWLLSGMAGGAQVVISHAARADKFIFWPQLATRDVLAFVVQR